MSDVDKFLVLIRDDETNAVCDRTRSIKWAKPDNGVVRVQFRNGGQSYPYRHPKARYLKAVGLRALKPTELLEV